MNYDSNMDAECIPLCDAINGMVGLRTVGSCCGHGQDVFRIWFEADRLENLPPLLYYLDSCHCGFEGWWVLVHTDCAMSPVTFKIEGPTGAFDQANRIAELIREDDHYFSDPAGKEVPHDPK